MNQEIVNSFSLKHTLDSAQFFNYTEEDGTYYCILRDSIFKVFQENDVLKFEGTNIEELNVLFGFDENYDEIVNSFNDEYLIRAVEKYYGLRLMRIDLWQTIIGFICSANANTSKIKMNMRLICEYFGEEVLFDNKKIYTFPNPGEINDIDKLILAKTGYRAKYILETNKMVLENPNLLSKINNSDYKTSKELLMKFPGVGPKVADCICLFALGHSEAFPIDTWVKKIIQQLYLKREAKNLKEIEDFINGYFVEHRGLKQQLLFHYMRNEK